MRKIVNIIVQETPGAIFRLYMAAVLLQFALLSFCSVNLTCESGTPERLHDLFLSTGFWYGQFSLFGAISLIFRSKVAQWKLGAFLGDLASVTMFGFLSYEYLTHRPPIYAGGIMAVTAILFLIGGLIKDAKRGCA